MTARSQLPRTRKLLAWRLREDAGHSIELRSQAEALALFDACVEEGGFSTAVAIYSFETNWRRSLAVGLLPLLAFAWLSRTRVRIDVDDRAGMLVATERGFGRGATVECRVDAVVDVVVAEAPYAMVTSRRLMLVLWSGERLPLTRHHFAFTRRGHARAAARLREILASTRTTTLSVES